MLTKTVYVTMKVPVRVYFNPTSKFAFVHISLTGDNAKTESGAIKALRARINEHVRSTKRLNRQEKRRGR